jgi:hypothetical protein
MLKFVIRAKMENGDVWETTRHTRDGLNNVVQNIKADKKVVSYTVKDGLGEVA